MADEAKTQNNRGLEVVIETTQNTASVSSIQGREQSSYDLRTSVGVCNALMEAREQFQTYLRFAGVGELVSSYRIVFTEIKSEEPKKS